MVNLKDQFDGEFVTVRASEIREHDVILDPARTVTGTPARSGGTVAVTTPIGPETHAPDAPVFVFRPAAASIAAGCPDCHAGPGAPCDAMCLAYAALDDAAGTGLA